MFYTLEPRHHGVPYGYPVCVYIYIYMIQLIFDVPFEHSPYLEKNSKNMSYAHYTFSNKTSHRKVNNV